MSQRYIGGLIYNPPGGFSGYFDGSGDYLTAPDGTAFTVGSGDWTLEAWIFSTATGSQKIAGQINSAGQTTSLSFGIALNSSSQPTVEAASGGTFYSASSSSAITLNAWTHIAAVRDGTTIRLYVNGTQAATVSVSTNSLNDSSDPFGIGRYGSYDAAYFSGYVSNLRFVKGTCLYPSGTAFTTPTGPLQAVTNTQLLTCAYSTFRDGSTNNFTITVNGNTAVSTQNPFPLTTLPNPALGNQGNGVYSMSQYQSLLSQNLWPAVDPYWRYVTLMLHGNGTNGAQNNTFLDSSTNNFTITRNGNTTQGTFSPYGSLWSNYFDGSGDYLDFVSSTNSTNFGTGDFTVEFWVYLPSVTSQQNLIDNLGGAQNALYVTGGTLYWYVGANRITGTSALSPNVWQHISLCRASGTTRLFVNGTQVGSNYSDSNNYAGGTTFPRIGAAFNGTVPTNGYISNVRVVKGTALYTTTFTPSASPLTAITNTSLLTCQSNRFIDNSTNNFAITRNGDVSVQRFSPFAPTAPYAAGTDGGSGYFDGSGDYIRVASNTDAALSLGTSDFTYEAWVYPTAFVSGSSVIGVQTQTNGTAGNGFALYLTNTGAPGVLAAASSGGYAVNFTGTAIPLNAWTHLAVTRSGNTFTLWRNGVSDGTATVSVTITQDSTSGYGGWNTGASPQTGQGHNGYIVDRLTKSGALYSTTFTPPSAPFTTTVSAGTVSLLCSMTNAGIIDNAEMNNLETVGNAQISTAQSKFGGASMLFDGSGDYLFAPGGNKFEIGGGDFTIELWVYSSTVNAIKALVSYGRSVISAYSDMSWTMQQLSDGKIVFETSNGGSAPVISITSTSALQANTWTHVALARSGSTFRLFFNGTAEVSGTSSASVFVPSSSNLYVGFYPSFSRDFNGYIDDLRITKGYARYTANFTPQRSQWQDQ